MRYKCSKCGSEVKPYGEGIIDLCDCPKKPIGLYVENGQPKTYGPAKKFLAIKDEEPEEKDFLVEVHLSFLKAVPVRASSKAEAAWKARELVEEDDFEYDNLYLASGSVGYVYEGKYEDYFEGDENGD